MCEYVSFCSILFTFADIFLFTCDLCCDVNFPHGLIKVLSYCTLRVSEWNDRYLLRSPGDGGTRQWAWPRAMTCRVYVKPSRKG